MKLFANEKALQRALVNAAAKQTADTHLDPLVRLARIMNSHQQQNADMNPKKSEPSA